MNLETLTVIYCFIRLGSAQSMLIQILGFHFICSVSASFVWFIHQMVRLRILYFG